MLGGEKAVALTNRELDRYKVITELVEQLYAIADAEGVSLCLAPRESSHSKHDELFARLKRWTREIR
jgi:hypothetical protein